MPTDIGLGFIVGGALVFVGFIIAFVTLAMNGGLAMGTAAFKNMGEMMSDPERKGAKRAMLLSFVLMGVGIPVLFVSVASGDAKRNRPCKKACVDSGFERGRFRGNPHQKPPKGERFKYECWCQRGKIWSPKPISLP